MPLVPDAIVALIQTTVNANMGAIQGYFPLAGQDPSYFMAMCTGIGTGIALGGPSISFTSSDTGMMGAPPTPGVGSGVGIVVDDSFMAQDMYTNIRNGILAQFGNTAMPAYPPMPREAGAYTLALCEGIATAIKTYFSTAWILSSVDPLIYAGSGTINNGDFTGLVAATIQAQILEASPTLLGPAWPTIATAIAQGYVDTIEQHSTGTLTIVGACIPGVAQVCGLPGAGTGTGTAA